MLQNNTLEIYPTSRAIREQLTRIRSQNQILPRMITIGEFEKKALLVPDRTFIDEDTRVLLMQEASDFSNFKSLNIDREFFTFLKNSKYLFSFFDELAVEFVEIETLKEFDTYASYDEHLEILATLQKKYKELLESRDYVDKMTLPSLYRLNYKFIRSFSRIDLYLEGYFNRFELQIFEEISEHTPLFIHLHANRFNQKMLDTFRTYGFALEIDHEYILDFQTKTIAQTKAAAKSETHYSVDAKQNAIEQIAFVKKKLYDFIQKGYKPEDIVVILPKSSTVDLLNLFDEENNFNFAMGFPFRKTDIYRKIDALYSYYMERSHENRHRIEMLGYDLQKIEPMLKKWSARLGDKKIIAMLQSLVEEEESESYRLYQTELLLFQKLLPVLSHYPFHKVIHLFLNRLDRLSLDDTRGGKVTVLEILETRAIQKEAVIVIDFNEGVLPSISRKDLFLSSAIREACRLPTPTDRENLQKYYYSRIFDRAKEVAVCYIEDEQHQPSRFLEELQLTQYRHDHGDLKQILLPFHTPSPHYTQPDLILPYDFGATPLSASALKTFLDCKRKYYFKYIQKFKEFEIPKEQDDERVVGVLLHEALKTVYAKKSTYLHEEDLLLDLQRELYLRSEESPSLRFVIDKWLEMLKPFIQHEVKHFAEGYTVFTTEKTFSAPFEKLELTGKIDRIDQKEGKFFIIDYKSGTLPKTTPKTLEKATDFQLQFYYLITQQLGDIEEAYYYDLKNASLQSEPLFDQKLDLLYSHLESLKATEFNFMMTEELQKCTFCPYQKICNRIM